MPTFERLTGTSSKAEEMALFNAFAEFAGAKLPEGQRPYLASFASAAMGDWLAKVMREDGSCDIMESLTWEQNANQKLNGTIHQQAAVIKELQGMVEGRDHAALGFLEQQKRERQTNSDSWNRVNRDLTAKNHEVAVMGDQLRAAHGKAEAQAAEIQRLKAAIYDLEHPLPAESPEVYEARDERLD